MAGFLDFDWRRLFRWSCLLSIVMAIWLLAPTVKCSFKAFEDTPIGDVDSDISQTDKDRVQQGTGFWSRWGGAMKECYREHRMLEQEWWKRDLLFLFLGLGVLSWTLDRLEKGRKRTLGG